MSLLSAEHVNVVYEPTRGQRIWSVRDVDLELAEGEFVGLVGESGCGKSTLGYALTRMQRPPARLEGGRIVFDGTDIASLERRAAAPSAPQRLRPRPAERHERPQSGPDRRAPLRRHPAGARTRWRGLDGRRRARARGRAARQGRPRPEVLRRYPHELSGGMRQRVAIALALSLDPRLIVFDEPTTALDVIVQGAVMRTIKQLQQANHFTALLISHDLGVVLEATDRVLVMYAGRIVEDQPSGQLLTGRASPVHRSAARLLRRSARRQGGAGRHSRIAAGPVRRTCRLPVRPAVPARRGNLPADRPAAHPAGGRLRGLPRPSSRGCEGGSSMSVDPLASSHHLDRRPVDAPKTTAGRPTRSSPSTTSRSRSRPARPWPSSARAAAASRPSPAHHRLEAAHVRFDPVRLRRHRAPARRRVASLPPRRADGVPGPVRSAESRCTPSGTRSPVRRRTFSACRAGRPTSGSMSCSRPSALRRPSSSSRSCRTSSRAGSASASSSRAHWRASRSSSSPTSRCRCSTCPCGPASCVYWPNCAPSAV